MHQVAIAALIIIALLVLWYCGPTKEHAELAAPNFDTSLVNKYRSYIKDNKGLSLNDYALESSIVDSTPLSGNYTIY
jgi:hypothetical protein